MTPNRNATDFKFILPVILDAASQLRAATNSLLAPLDTPHLLGLTRNLSATLQTRAGDIPDVNGSKFDPVVRTKPPTPGEVVQFYAEAAPPASTRPTVGKAPPPPSGNAPG